MIQPNFSTQHSGRTRHVSCCASLLMSIIMFLSVDMFRHTSDQNFRWVLPSYKFLRDGWLAKHSEGKGNRIAAKLAKQRKFWKGGSSRFWEGLAKPQPFCEPRTFAIVCFWLFPPCGTCPACLCSNRSQIHSFIWGPLVLLDVGVELFQPTVCAEGQERQLQIENSWDYGSIGWSLPQECKNKIQEWWCARPTSKKLEPYPDLVALSSFGRPYVVISKVMIYQHRCHFYCLKGRHNSSSSTDDVHEAGAVCLHDKLWMRLCLQNSTTIRRSLQARTLLNLTESSSPSVTFLFMAYDSRQIWGFNSVSATGKLCRCKCYADVSEAQGPAAPPGHLGKVLPWCSARPSTANML